MTLKRRPRGRKRSGKLGSASLYLAVPGILIAGPMVGFLAGQWADKKFDTEPWLLALGLILGFVASGREIYRLIQKAQAMDEEDNGHSDGT